MGRIDKLRLCATGLAAFAVRLPSRQDLRSGRWQQSIGLPTKLYGLISKLSSTSRLQRTSRTTTPGSE